MVKYPKESTICGTLAIRALNKVAVDDSGKLLLTDSALADDDPQAQEPSEGEIAGPNSTNPRVQSILYRKYNCSEKLVLVSYNWEKTTFSCLVTETNFTRGRGDHMPLARLRRSSTSSAVDNGWRGRRPILMTISSLPWIHLPVVVMSFRSRKEDAASPRVTR